ncbi:AYR1 [Sanghuangporus weigelae]
MPSSTKNVVLITGCSKGGIGYHLCEEFAKRGCIVYATARNLDSMDGLEHPSIRRLQLEVTSDESVQGAVDDVIAEEGRIDVLVNNAGGICIGPVVEVPMEEVKRTFDVNVYGALRTARTVVPHMAARKKGIIVNIGSVSGEVPTPWNGIYCASKAALHSLTSVLQMECQPLGISVVLVAPGSIKSNLADNQAKRFNLPPTSLYQSFLQQMHRRMYTSQGRGSMPTSAFAKTVVERVMSRAGPPSYILLGGHTLTIRFLRWLPRGLVLWLVWRAFSAK